MYRSDEALFMTLRPQAPYRPRYAPTPEGVAQARTAAVAAVAETPSALEVVHHALRDYLHTALRHVEQAAPAPVLTIYGPSPVVGGGVARVSSRDGRITVRLARVGDGTVVGTPTLAVDGRLDDVVDRADRMIAALSARIAPAGRAQVRKPVRDAQAARRAAAEWGDVLTSRTKRAATGSPLSRRLAA